MKIVKNTFAWVIICVITIVSVLFIESLAVGSSIARVNAVCSDSNISFHVANSDTTIEFIDNTIQRFLRREGLKGGASVAISKYGKLVYAKGIGWNDVEDSISMKPYNIMRVASVSKLITAVAIMRLVERGRIALHQRVFGPTGILNDDKYIAFKDRRMGDVTIYELLNHSGGWSIRYGDPMFMPQSIARQMGKQLPISMEDIIKFMQTKSMHFVPGSGSVYSNFGYGLLGEIVAKASGMPYEDFVRSEVLAPLGIYDMQIGRSRISERLENEVKYYEVDTSYCAFDYTDGDIMVRRSYGGTDIRTLGSAGGWVASATDLLKLTLTIDGMNYVPDQISRESIDTMTHHKLGFDPIGWRTVKGESWYRSGTLAATSAMIARRPDSICYAVILNCSNHKGPKLATEIRLIMDQVVSRIEKWPDIDMWQDDKQWMRYVHKE